MSVEKLSREVEELRKQVALLSERIGASATKAGAKGPKSSGHQNAEEILRKAMEGCSPVEGYRGAVFHTGLIKGGDSTVSWTASITADALMKCPPSHVSRLVSPFSAEQRVAILRALFPTPKGVQKLEQITGLSSGQIYHHMKELMFLEYVTQTGRNVYSLSSKGLMILFSLLALVREIAPPGKEMSEKVKTPASSVEPAGKRKRGA